MSFALLNFDELESALVSNSPYTYMVAKNVINIDKKDIISIDYPQIKSAGFFPLESIKYEGVFKNLIQELQAPKLADILTKKLKIELKDKPFMITIRRWSTKSDGRIHNDSKSKIVTALLYLNDNWLQGKDGGSFRVLKDKKTFESAAAIIPPEFGSFVVFVRSENSWHGHMPFEGERRVIQITWLNSIENIERKNKRGKLTLFLKNIFSRSVNVGITN
ncbi:2OG-Fe(II) oxygenase [Candidatus Tisiphia endosymbiont of Myopa tessellatipennis]|uniref:2OG-Fe(II) oxygenase n=1 Tax=Candidatus Tisiphia endosymbiont of Myopa tessellatipennis TaxID=3066257 RepID=UPI00313AAB80